MNNYCTAEQRARILESFRKRKTDVFINVYIHIIKNDIILLM